MCSQCAKAKKKEGWIVVYEEERRYRLYFWMMILSGVVLASALIVTSLRKVQTDKSFSQMILDENKTFLVHTLRFSHGMMARMKAERYEDLIDLALKSKFIRYLAILDDGGKGVVR